MNNNGMSVRVKYINGQQPLEKIGKGDWIDVRANEDYRIYPGQSVNIKLGFCMELPKGYHAQLLPRGGTWKKYRIIMTNGEGIIDETFNGDNDEWVMPVFKPFEAENCYTDEDRNVDLHTIRYGVAGTMSSKTLIDSTVDRSTVIKRGDRIGQFRIVKNMPPVEFISVEKLGNEDRGMQGSTGVNEFTDTCNLDAVIGLTEKLAEYREMKREELEKDSRGGK